MSPVIYGRRSFSERILDYIGSSEFLPGIIIFGLTLSLLLTLVAAVSTMNREVPAISVVIDGHEYLKYGESIIHKGGCKGCEQHLRDILKPEAFK